MKFSRDRLNFVPCGAVWGTLEALTVEGCIFAGDTNVRAIEHLPEDCRSKCVFGAFPSWSCRDPVVAGK